MVYYDPDPVRKPIVLDKTDPDPNRRTKVNAAGLPLCISSPLTYSPGFMYTSLHVEASRVIAPAVAVALPK